MLKFKDMLDTQKCYEMIRQHRWPKGVCCPRCHKGDITSKGEHHRHPYRRRYFCNSCERHFDDLTLSVFSGHHQPLNVWLHCLYLMSLNLSNRQISHELELNQGDVQNMTEQLRKAVHEKKPEVKLSGEVECDEVYVVAGHKGQPQEVKKRQKTP